MMLTIHGLPPRTTFQTLKTLIKQECNVADFILDNLVDDGPNSKKVRIGVSDDSEGYGIMKCLDGFRMSPTHLLKIVPVGKQILNKPEGFNHRDEGPGFQSQPRNSYPNQSRSDYQPPTHSDYGRGPPGPHGMPDRHPTGPGGDNRQYPSDDLRNAGPRSNFRPNLEQRPGPESRNLGPQGSQDGQWGSNMNPPHQSGQWIPIQNQNQSQGYNQRPAPGINPGFGQQPSQGPQNSYGPGRGPQGPPDTFGPRRGAPDQRYGFQPKPNVPVHTDARAHNLRSVEIVDTPRPYQQDKPITIMKDNFQGPTQYNVSGPPQHNQFQGPNQAHGPVWNQPNQQPKPQVYDDRRHPPMEKRPDIPKQMDQGYDKRGQFSSQMNPRQSPGRDLKGYPASGRPFPDRHMSPRPGQSRMPVREFSPSGRRISPPGRKFSPPGRRISPSGRKFSPSGRRMSPSGRKFSPPGRRISPSGRQFSPTGRGISPSDRRRSPPGRKFSPPSQRISPSGRRDSPPGRKFSPSGRRISPSGRRDSPSGRKFSPPDRRMSPSGRKFSPPGRKFSPHGSRSSPPGRRVTPPRGREEPHRMSPSMTQSNYYLEDDLRNRMGRRDSPRRLSPKRSSPNRRLVSPPRSGRYSPNDREDSVDKFIADNHKALKPIRPAYEAEQAQKYTGGYRQDTVHLPGRQERPTWQPEKNYPPKRDLIRIEFLRRSEASDKPARESRSPTRRDRSPLNRYRRQSPSSRSPRSPRRSWALEKRNSPEEREPPPPPIWPGQEDEKLKRKSRFELESEPKHVPVWERPDRRADDVEFEPPKVRVRSDLGDKFSSRREIEEKRDSRPEISREHERDYHRDESPKGKGVLADIDKDFQDIYKRSVEFRKKAEEMRKSGERRRDYEQDRRDRSPPRNRSADRSREQHDDTKKEWQPQERKRMSLTPAVRNKREKAIDEISNKILDKYEMHKDVKYRITEEVRLALSDILMNMFGDKDVSFIELVVKYNAKYNAKEEEQLMRDLLSKMPSQYRNLKRKEKDTSEIPAKMSRHSPPREDKEEKKVRPKLADAVVPDWNVVDPPKVINLPLGTMNAMNSVMNMSPVVVPAPVYVPQVDIMAQQQNVYQGQSSFAQPVADNGESYNLYLCQDDFEPFSDLQADYLKNFLISQMIRVTESNQGWAPDFTLKGLQSMYRYELSTKDVVSKDWLVNLNFAEFEFFNVLVYTKEELWYERAAIWLPGHSRVRNIEPLDKLKLQNKHFEGVNIGKWKFVKKVVAEKGTRLYVDMPPSSARALETHKMMLSYELQKVNVFLKAVAVDKDSFDAGLKESSLTDQALLVAAVQNSPMPTLSANTETGLIKIGLNGHKTVSPEQARKIKEVLVYQLFKYHQQDGKSKTDFLKYGFCTPGFFAVVPENKESKRWLLSRQFGKINRHAIVVFGNDDENTKYFKMTAYIPHAYQASTQLAFERLKQSNQGVKGLHFNLWKPVTIKNERKRAALTLDVDLESVETLIKLKYKLDYVGEFGIQRVDFKSEYSHSKLEEKIKRYKLEQVDTYDDAKMDLGSDEDDDIICLE